jgi:hypothetical protein
LLLLPFAARELTREMDNHHHRRNQDATQNVNVKTAAPESSRKIGKTVSYTILVAEQKKLSGGT